MGDFMITETKEESMRELIQGAYDLHVHTAPDVLPRRLDDFEMAQRVMDSGICLLYTSDAADD